MTRTGLPISFLDLYTSQTGLVKTRTCSETNWPVLQFQTDMKLTVVPAATKSPYRRRLETPKCRLPFHERKDPSCSARGCTAPVDNVHVWSMPPSLLIRPRKGEHPRAHDWI